MPKTQTPRSTTWRLNNEHALVWTEEKLRDTENKLVKNADGTQKMVAVPRIIPKAAKTGVSATYVGRFSRMFGPIPTLDDDGKVKTDENGEVITHRGLIRASAEFKALSTASSGAVIYLDLPLDDTVERDMKTLIRASGVPFVRVEFYGLTSHPKLASVGMDNEDARAAWLRNIVKVARDAVKERYAPVTHWLAEILAALRVTTITFTTPDGTVTVPPTNLLDGDRMTAANAVTMAEGWKLTPSKK